MRGRRHGTSPGAETVLRASQFNVPEALDDWRSLIERKDIDALLETLESNYLGWSSTMAPAIMGAPDRPELGEELTNSFCRTDPDIAKQFARVTFLSDNRAVLRKLKTPTLIVQSSDDFIAPVSVGEFMRRTLPNGTTQTRNVDVSCDKDAATCIKQVVVGKEP